MTKQGGNLDDFVNKIFKLLITHYPDEPLSRLEEVAHFVKHPEQISTWLKTEESRDHRGATELALAVKQMQEAL